MNTKAHWTAVSKTEGKNMLLINDDAALEPLEMNVTLDYS